MKKNKREKGLILVVVTLLVGAVLTPNIFVENVRADPIEIFSDDFEDSTLNKWNVVSGNWEVISESGFYV